MKTTGLKKGTAVSSANDATLEDGKVATGDKSVAASWELVPDSEFEAPSGLREMTLEVLAKNINGRLDKIETAVSSARKYAETALLAAMETGHYLNESRRKCEQGKWGTWREQHCPGLSKATAHRYMDLADNVSHVRHDKSIRTLRQAYIVVGLVSEPASPKPRDLTDRRSSTDFLSGLQSSRAYVVGLQDLSTAAMAQMGTEFLKQMSDEVSELSKVCEKLKEKLNDAKKIKPVKAVEKAPASVRPKTGRGKRRRS